MKLSLEWYDLEITSTDHNIMLRGLINAQSLLSHETYWCQKHAIQDLYGNRVNQLYQPQAAKYCLLGSVWSSFTQEEGAQETLAEGLLKTLAREKYSIIGLIDLNDNGKREECYPRVVDVLSLAVETLRNMNDAEKEKVDAI